MSEESTLPITPVETEGTQPVAAVPGPDLSVQLESLKAKNAELIGERRKDQEKFKELQDQLNALSKQSSQQKQKKLAEAGEFKTLWEEANRSVAERDATITELQAQLERQSRETEQQQIRAQAVNAMTQQGVFAPDQLYTLMQGNLRVRNGAVMAIHGGVEVPLQQHLQNLRNPNSGFEHFFRASGSGGIGTPRATPNATSGMVNPYRTGNMTQIVNLELTNPDLAKQLKQEASAG